MTLAVHGAITITSASSASEMWWTRCVGSSHSETATGSPVSVRNVSGVTKRCAAAVMTTFTRQPRRMSSRATSHAL